MSKDGKRYYSEIKTLIPFCGSYEKQMLKQIRERIIQITNDHPNAAYEIYCEILGNPVNIINEYYANVDTAYLINNLRIARIIRVCMHCTLVLVFVAFFSYIAFTFKRQYDYEKAAVTHEEIVMDYEKVF